jgi:diguanylate cyclase (GGDEF)-like protein/PAS domain S-box-containing protein
MNASTSERVARLARSVRRLFRHNSVAFVLATLVTLQLGVAAVSIYALSAMRAYVTGESLYSKGQKDAMLNLYAYLRSHDDNDYQRFLANIHVPTGDKQARLAMQQAVPDVEGARQGFLAAKNHPADIDSMIWLFRWGQHLPFIAPAIDVWTQADACVEELRLMVARARTQIVAGRYESLEQMEMQALTPALNEKLTRLESEFSEQLGQAARTLQALLLAVNAAVAVFLITAGGCYMCRTTRIQRRNEADVRELVDAVGDAILACDDGHRLAIFNRAAERMFGCDAQEALGQPISRFLKGFTGKNASPCAQQRTGNTVQRLNAVHFDGAAILIEASVSNITTGAGLLTIVTCRDVTERDAAQERERHAMSSRNCELVHTAHTDALTGLSNRAALELAFERLLGTNSCGSRLRFAVLFLDLDGFKAVNDSLGHMVGDELLQHVARRLKQAARADDEVFRVSGDEFVVVARCDEDPQVGEVLSKRILAAVCEAYLLDGDALARITVSVGVANFPDDGLDARTLLSAADAAMYHAKRGGKNNYHVGAKP